MKVAFRSAYGSPDVISIKEIPIPTPGENDLLIKVHATTVNRSDCHILTGRPFMMKVFTGLLKPRVTVTGIDFAGEVEMIGRNVTRYKKGDRLMGFGGSFAGIQSHAQFMLLPEEKATKISISIPGHLDYEQAAASLEGAIYAGGITLLPLKSGQKALVYGATGAIGSAHVQFLKYYGLSVTAVCKGEHTELIRSLGAERVIDYTREDFTKDKDRYDLILDSVGKTSFAKCRHLLKKNGMFTSSGGAENIFLMLITPLFGGKKVVFKTFLRVKKGLDFIRNMIDQKAFRPVIDRRYPIEQIADAYRYVASGEKIGNVIISMD
jgi:NADPH:quinone reductase-like Zn-dependent oxidoreductase